MISFDLLGAGHRRFPKKRILNLLPYKVGVGMFDDDIFGKTASSYALELYKIKKIVALRVHLYWDPGHKQLCPLKYLADRATFWNIFAEECPDLRVYLSHTCEHTSTDVTALKRRMNLIREHAPLCVPVNSVIKKGAILPGEVNEKHGLFTPLSTPYIASLDGTEAFDVNVKSWLSTHRNSRMACVWTHGLNLRKKGAAFVPIKNRVIQISAKDFKKLILQCGLQPGN